MYHDAPGYVLTRILEDCIIVSSPLQSPDFRVVTANTYTLVLDHLRTGIRVRLWASDTVLHFECRATWFGQHARRAMVALNAALDLLSTWAAEQPQRALRQANDRSMDNFYECMLQAKMARSSWAAVIPGRLQAEVVAGFLRRRCYRSLETVVVRDCPQHMRVPVLYLLAHTATMRYGGAQRTLEFHELMRASSFSSGWTVLRHPTPPLRVLWSVTPWPRELYRYLLNLSSPCRRPYLPPPLLVYFRRSDSSSSNNDRRLREIAAYDFTFPPTPVT